jgi:hypothetical protein
VDVRVSRLAQSVDAYNFTMVYRECKPAHQTLPLLLSQAPTPPHSPIPDFLPSLNTTRRATIRGKWKTEMGWRSHHQRGHQRWSHVWRRHQRRSYKWRNHQWSPQVMPLGEAFSSISTAPCRLKMFPIFTQLVHPARAVASTFRRAASSTAGAAAAYRNE